MYGEGAYGELAYGEQSSSVGNASGSLPSVDIGTVLGSALGDPVLGEYTNDLTTVATGDLNFDAGTWDESSDGGWDTAGAMVDDENLWYTDNSINTGEAASSCTSAQYTKNGSGSGATGPGTIMYQHTAAFTVPTDGVVLIQSLWAAPPALNVYEGTPGSAEAGVSVLIGDTFGVFDVHYVSGSNKAPSPEGGWATYAVDPTITPDTSIGSPTTTRTVGVGIAATQQARGNPQACQSVRYGRCEVGYTRGASATPATFEGYAAIDNAAADRFNLLQIIAGGYKARGLMSFGTALTPVYFSDSDKSIVIADDPKVGVNFNKGVVSNSSSELYWTNIAITNLSSVAKYSFTINDAATTNHKGCVFTDLGAFTYGSNSTQINTTYRRQELVTQGGSIFTSCIFDKAVSSIALDVDDLDIVTDCEFNSDGSNYAVGLGTISSMQSSIWDNIQAGYVTGVASIDAGDDVGLTPTGNETITCSVDSGVILTLNVANEASIPSVANSGLGTVLVLTGQITLTVATQNGNEVRFKQGSHTLQHTQDVTGGQVTYTYSYAADTKITVSVGGASYSRQTINLTLASTDTLLDVQLIPDPSYI